MYTDRNYQTKKALREAFAAGKSIGVHQPGGMFASKTDGPIALEGPHYPQAHTWYAEGEIADGLLVKLDGKTAEQVAAQLLKASSRWPKGKKFGELTDTQKKAAMANAVDKLAKDPTFRAAIATVFDVPVDKVEISHD